MVNIINLAMNVQPSQLVRILVQANSFTWSHAGDRGTGQRLGIEV